MQKWPLRFSNFIPVHVRMETSAAEVQLGQCRNHEQTRNDGGVFNRPSLFNLKDIILGKEKTKKTFNHFKLKNGQPISGQDIDSLQSRGQFFSSWKTSVSKSDSENFPADR